MQFNQLLYFLYIAIGGLFGTVLQSIPQLALQQIGGIFGRPSITLPEKAPDFGGSGGGGGSSSGSQGTGSCKCTQPGSCFLPSTQGVGLHLFIFIF